MLGAIIGDVVGSRFEWNNNRSKQFDFLTFKCSVTDDSIMSLAIAKALLESKSDYSDLSVIAVKHMQDLGRRYPNCGYGGRFRDWIHSDNPKPYESFGNGAAMRVSACGFVANSLEEVPTPTKAVTEVTHNHPEGLKGAEAIAVAVFLARSGENLLEIRDYITEYYYPLNFTLDGIRDKYAFNQSCQDTVPQALEAFFESKNFEDAIRNAISIGGDSDTLAAITGGIAEAYYGIPTEIRKHASTFLDEHLLKILVEFENKYPAKMERVQCNKSVSIVRKIANQVKIGSRADMMSSSVEAADKELKASKVESEETTSKQLFNHIFEACNILRGPINQDEFKSYVTPILFFKRISDVYDEETERALEESGGDIDYAAFPEQHSFIIPEGCHWGDIRKATVDVGKAIVAAMNGIERENPDTLSGVFSSFDDATWTDKAKLTDERLKDLVEHMSKLRVGNNNYSADVMGDSYEFLIKKFADLSKKNAGEFYTPRSIVKLMVMLMQPKPGDSVYDPACGTGGMLIEAIRHIHDDQMTYGKIYGQEKNLSTSAIAKMNLFLHGAYDFKISQGDTLRQPSFVEHGKLQTFNCVLANPPFSLEKWGASQFETDKYGRNLWGCPSDSSADFAWLQHMVKSMDQKSGKCAVVLPQGVLFHGGKVGKMREQLVESDLLECVITLASGVFYSTGVSACILFLNNKKKDTSKGRVCLIDASNIYTPRRAQNIMTEDDIQKVYDIFTAYESKTDYCKVATKDDIRKEGYTLAVGTYIEMKKQENTPPVEVRMQYFEAVQSVRENEARLKDFLSKGGYINE